ncbi:MAG: DUF3783 domain-containing protein [Clostridia bacterium]|nr:DUF3783 domain-containing protein [Clostridia bacterium]
MSRPTLLCVNIPADKLARVRFSAMRLGLLIQTVLPEDVHQPLGALCGLLPRLEDVPAEPFGGEMLIMANLNRQQAERLLASLKQSRVQIPLKAVLTPTNVQWSLVRLHEELTRERAAVLRGETDDHTAE